MPDRSEVLKVLIGISDEAQDQAAAALASLLTAPERGRVLRVAPDQSVDTLATPVIAESAVVPDVIDALCSLGTHARPALPALEALLNHDDHILRDSAGLAVVAILGKFNERSIAILVSIIIDEELPRDWRMSAVFTLGKIGPIRARRGDPRTDPSARPRQSKRPITSVLSAPRNSWGYPR